MCPLLTNVSLDYIGDSFRSLQHVRVGDSNASVRRCGMTHAALLHLQLLRGEGFVVMATCDGAAEECE